MTRSMTQGLIALVFLLAATGVRAHEGHAVATAPSDSLLHWLTHPDHILPLVGAVVLLAGVVGGLIRQFKR